VTINRYHQKTAEVTATVEGTANPEIPESQIAALLQYRYGDGLVYLPRHRSSTLYDQARQQGYIDASGYLTRKGRALIARYQYL
jgi:hypothetical protein